MSYLIPQWNKQKSVALILPHKNTHWNKYFQEILDDYFSLVKLLANFQDVLLISQDLDISKKFQSIKNVKIIQGNYNDTWARDILPISIKVNNEIKLLDFEFNGWGEKYDFSKDNNLSKSIFKNLHKINFCLEGGGIDNNGEFLLINRQTFDFNRNDISFAHTIEVLENTFNAKVLVLNNGSIKGDDTNSHIDTLARFVNKNTIVYSSCDDKNNINYNALLDMKKELFEIAEKYKFNLVGIDIPKEKYYKNRILIATYINFIILNNAVIVPTYDDKNDKNALNIMKKYFPNREVVGFDANTFIRENGSLHCASCNFFANFQQI